MKNYYRTAARLLRWLVIGVVSFVVASPMLLTLQDDGFFSKFTAFI